MTNLVHFLAAILLHGQTAVAQPAVVAPQALVDLSAIPAAGGRISGGGMKNIGSTVTIAAAASNGWRFVNWSDDVTKSSRSIPVPSNGVSLAANFTIATGVLSFDTNAINFGDAPVSLVASQNVGIVNSGPGTVQVSRITLPSGFSAKPASFAIAAGATQRVAIFFKPSHTNSYGGAVTLHANAARPPPDMLIVCGNGIPQTRVARLDGDFDFGETYTGQPVARTLTVWNDGNSPMTISSVSWSNNTDTSFSVKPSALKVASGGSAAMTVTFTPKSAIHYDNVGLRLHVASLTGGSNTVLLAGGATAYVQGTWSGALSSSRGSINGTCYAWQDGSNHVVALIPTTHGITGVFAGQVQNRSQIPGALWTNTIYAGAITLNFSAGPKLAGTVTNAQIKVSFARSSTNLPPAIVEPVVPALPDLVATQTAAAQKPASCAPRATTPETAILFTISEFSPDQPPVCARDGICASWQMQNGRTTVTFPGDGADAGATVVSVLAQGAAQNTNGLPDEIMSALGGVPPDGATILAARVENGWLLLETPYIENLQIEGAPVPVEQLPATWRITPVAGAK